MLVPTVTTLRSALRWTEAPNTLDPLATLARVLGTISSSMTRRKARRRTAGSGWPVAMLRSCARERVVRERERSAIGSERARRSAGRKCLTFLTAFDDDKAASAGQKRLVREGEKRSS